MQVSWVRKTQTSGINPLSCFLHCWILMWLRWLQAHSERSKGPHARTFIYFHWLRLKIQPVSRGRFSGQPWRRKQERRSELTFKYYLLGWGLTQKADHTALQWPEKMNDGNERIGQRSLAIEPLRSVIHHIPGQQRSRLALSPGGWWAVFDGHSHIIEGLRFDTVTHVSTCRGPQWWHHQSGSRDW